MMAPKLASMAMSPDSEALESSAYLGLRLKIVINLPACTSQTCAGEISNTLSRIVPVCSRAAQHSPQKPKESYLIRTGSKSIGRFPFFLGQCDLCWHITCDHAIYSTLSCHISTGARRSAILPPPQRALVGGAHVGKTAVQTKIAMSEKMETGLSIWKQL